MDNKLTGGKGDELGVNLKFATLKDFEPEQIARQVPELAQLLETREALRRAEGAALQQARVPEEDR